MTYKELIVEALKQTKEPLTSEQIWLKACEIGLGKKLSSVGKTPIKTIEARIYTSIKRKENHFIFAYKKPTTFWLKAREGELAHLKINDALADEKDKQEKNPFHERDLHPLLVKFLYENSNFNLQCKTIYHEKSRKAAMGKDKWNYPDIVGAYFPYDDYNKETLTLLHNIGQNSYKFFSFELKISLDFSNLKESYFQAVSNCSWANEGYLVVFKEIDDEVLSELRRLNQNFGIGVIKLECDILDSKILLSSKERELDIQTLNMLLEKNSDFKTFIEDINKQIKAGFDTEIKAKFDKVFDDEEMQKYLKEKYIGVG
ncbi:HTH domain-containing protein [uncultured Helicobacter sp.]|uniref:HTH domain-containing protein n=1 Tax=uncultured Helicobacter sp. TaxID=175537 RepID=UPI00262E3B62|nr:HTH domain-containing protein [uncultured Helicobacter sp.]